MMIFAILAYLARSSLSPERLDLAHFRGTLSHFLLHEYSLLDQKTRCKYSAVYIARFN